MNERPHAGGWLRLYRKALDSEVGCDDETLGFWVRLLSVANWKAKWYRGLRIEPGQLLLTDRGMRDRLYPSSEKQPAVNTIKNRMASLEAAGKIELAVVPGVGRLLTIKHWAYYQNDAASNFDAQADADVDAPTDAPTDARADARADANRRRNKKEKGDLKRPTTTTPNKPLSAKWMRVRTELNELGMSEANAATIAARDGDLSFEFIKELIHDVRTNHATFGRPDAAIIGKLCNQLKGVNRDLPFQQEEGERRYSQRIAEQREQANAIRQSVRTDGERRGSTSELIAAVTFNRLCKAGLEEFATDEERMAAKCIEAKRRDRAG